MKLLPGAIASIFFTDTDAGNPHKDGYDGNLNWSRQGKTDGFGGLNDNALKVNTLIVTVFGMYYFVLEWLE